MSLRDEAYLEILEELIVLQKNPAKPHLHCSRDLWHSTWQEGAALEAAFTQTSQSRAVWTKHDRILPREKSELLAEPSASEAALQEQIHLLTRRASIGWRGFHFPEREKNLPR